jgi:hypothetical protein
MAVAVFAVEASRLGTANGRESGPAQATEPTQDVASLTTRTFRHVPDACPLLVVTNHWHEVESLLSDYRKAAYVLGRDFLLANPETELVEIWVPLRPEHGIPNQGDRIACFVLRRTNRGFSWVYENYVTTSHARSYDRSHEMRPGRDE